MFLRTRRTILRVALVVAGGERTHVTVGLILKSFKSGVKFFLNSDPLSKITFVGLGYRANHTWLNS